MQLFVAICEEGTLTRAAKREGIAASALSKRLNELEHALGAGLFIRHSKGMILTLAGETLLHYARSILLSVVKMGAEIGEYTQGVRGHIRMLANISAIVEFLPDDLRSFFSDHDAVKIDLEERLSAGVVRGVEEGAGDLGICVATTESRDLATRLYHRDRLVLAVPDMHPLARYDTISFIESLEYDHIGFHADSAIYTRSRVAAAQVGKVVKLRIQVPGFDAVCRMVQSGLGVAVIPDRAFEVTANKQAIKAVNLSDDWAKRELKIVMRDEAILSPAGRLMVDHLERCVRMSENNGLAPPNVALPPLLSRMDRSLPL